MPSPAKKSVKKPPVKKVKPPVKKAAPATKATTPAPSAKSAKPAPASTKAPASAKTVPLTPAERMKMIAEAAYFIAEKHGFSHGRELTDWMAAENQVDALTKSVSNKR